MNKASKKMSDRMLALLMNMAISRCHDRELRNRAWRQVEPHIRSAARSVYHRRNGCNAHAAHMHDFVEGALGVVYEKYLGLASSKREVIAGHLSNWLSCVLHHHLTDLYRRSRVHRQKCLRDFWSGQMSETQFRANYAFVSADAYHVWSAAVPPRPQEAVLDTRAEEHDALEYCLKLVRAHLGQMRNRSHVRHIVAELGLDQWLPDFATDEDLAPLSTANGHQVICRFWRKISKRASAA